MRLSGSCDECAAKDRVIVALIKALGNPQPSPLPREAMMPAPRFDPSKCPCNPARGGSGICGCIMSGPTITCTSALARVARS